MKMKLQSVLRYLLRIHFVEGMDKQNLDAAIVLLRELIEAGAVTDEEKMRELIKPIVDDWVDSDRSAKSLVTDLLAALSPKSQTNGETEQETTNG